MLKSMGLRAELRCVPGWLDGAGPKVNLALFGIGLGGAVPWMLGFEFLDPIVLTGISLACVVFVGAVAGNAGQDADPSHVVARVQAIALAGTAYAVTVVLLGLIVVNVRNWHGAMLLPATVNLLTLPLLPAGLSAFLGAEGIRMALRGHKPREIGARFRWTVLLLVMAWYLRGYWMPAAVREWIESYLVSSWVAIATVAIAAILGALAVIRLRKLRLAH